MSNEFKRDRSSRFRDESRVAFRAPDICHFNFLFEQVFKDVKRVLALSCPDHAEVIKGEPWSTLLCARGDACGLWNAKARRCLVDALGTVCAMSAVFHNMRNDGLFELAADYLEREMGRKL